MTSIILPTISIIFYNSTFIVPKKIVKSADKSKDFSADTLGGDDGG